MSDNSTFALLDPEFFVPFGQKTPGPEYQALVAGLNAAGWRVQRGGVWTHVVPPGWQPQTQGWKLHLSATPAHAPEVLQRTARVLEVDPAAFKFASDPVVHLVMNSKNWPREGSGKFITIYPVDDDQFRRLATALAAATEGLQGPYILSDRRVPGSRTVFYRYGEHSAAEAVDARGQRVQQIVSPSGEAAPDRRRSYYALPEWLQDPYGARATPVLESGEPKVTLRERYQVRGALTYSNVGGVYHGHDLLTDEPVVIRERRPFTGWVDTETDSVALLHKEGRILAAMADTGWVPRLVDAFAVWEHHYLVMEQVRGVALRDYAMSRYLGPRRLGSPRALFTTFRALLLRLLDAVEGFHRRGIILRDLTAGNVLVRPDRSLCLIDFEYAWERDGQLPYAARIHTPGSASPAQMAGDAPTEADDYHALGAIVVELCSMMAPGLDLHRGGVMAMAEMMMAEMGLPRMLLEVADGLLAPDPAVRWTGDPVRAALARVRPSTLPRQAPVHGAREANGGGEVDGAAENDLAPRAALVEACERLAAFFEASAGHAGPELLWPASPDAHGTNGASIQFGAGGPVEFVRRVRGTVPDAWLEWLEGAAVPERCPPGMYTGLAGVALTLDAAGQPETVGRLLRVAAADPRLADTPGLYHGVAGVGTVALALAARQDDPELERVAVRIGDELAARARRRARGLAWPVDGTIAAGLGAGGSGIALFYTYLGARIGEPRYWELAKQALRFEFSQARWRAGYAFWPSAAGPRPRFRSPHVYFGSAGVATAAARLYACTGDPDVRSWAETAARTLTFRWTNKLWQDFGYAGWGETLLDMQVATGEAAYHHHARRMAQVLLAAQVPTRFGTAFPGGALNRVAADFGMGASGIGVFLHRLATPGTERAFYPDHLLPGWSPALPETPARIADALVVSELSHAGTA